MWNSEWHRMKLKATISIQLNKTNRFFFSWLSFFSRSTVVFKIFIAWNVFLYAQIKAIHPFWFFVGVIVKLFICLRLILLFFSKTKRKRKTRSKKTAASNGWRSLDDAGPKLLLCLNESTHKIPQMSDLKYYDKSHNNKGSDLKVRRFHTQDTTSSPPSLPSSSTSLTILQWTLIFLLICNERALARVSKHFMARYYLTRDYIDV